MLTIGKFTTTSPAQTAALGGVVGAALAGGEIIAFSGGMGMGKTVFTSGLAKSLGYMGDVSSPTFSLLHEYRGGKYPICHIDAFRLQSGMELEDIGFYDYLDRGWVIVIEWSEQVQNALLEPDICIDFARIDDDTREITITRRKK